MNSIWLPEKEPPLVDGDAITKIMDRVLERGLVAIAYRELSVLKKESKAFNAFVKNFGTKLNELSTEGPWPDRAFKMGVALARVAYSESGYYQVIDGDAVDSGNFLAELWGEPDIYQTRYHEDESLRILVQAAIDNAPDLVPDPELGYSQIITIGAGATRHYLQPAVLAA